MYQTEKRISEFKDRSFGIMQSEEQKEKKDEKEKRKPMGLMGGHHSDNLFMQYCIPEGKEMEEKVESCFKAIAAENFPNLGRGLVFLQRMSDCQKWINNVKWEMPVF